MPSPKSWPIWAVIATAVAVGLVLFVVDLGSVGLVDETPPLFASSARAMVRSGDWLIPQVNGLPRYDKPPLVYWLMAGFYSLPGHASWDPLGSWAAALPSALASLGVLVLLALVVAWWERRCLPQPQGVWLPAALCFGLSPLVMLWSRIGVSDSLLTALLALAMISSWWRLESPRIPWWLCWLALGLATLTKGPVAFLLFGLTWGLFGLLQRPEKLNLERLRPVPGVLLSLVVAVPWFAAAALREGEPFVQSFFGYHNLQRFAEVVNRHESPWWLYGALLVVASLPWSPLLLLGLWRALVGRQVSLASFAACWLLAVLVLFSCSATKLPSYWLPATPAAAILAALALARRDRVTRWAVLLSVVLSMSVGVAFAASPIWLRWLADPDLVDLPERLQRMQVGEIAASLLIAGSVASAVLLFLKRSNLSALFAVQLSWLLLVPFVFLPLVRLGDDLRSTPLRAIASLAKALNPASSPLVALGDPKPSLHFYSERIVLYESGDDQGLVNVYDRLLRDPRVLTPGFNTPVLLVSLVDLESNTYWSSLLSPRVQQQSRYGLWWLDLRKLEERARLLQLQKNLQPTWQLPRPERF